VAHDDRGIIEVGNSFSNEPPKRFTFDAVFANKVTQRKVYDVCAAPVVQSVLTGYNGTIFVYGQTGSGKVRDERIMDEIRLPVSRGRLS